MLKSGDWPTRKRGYYRALKRGDEWAVKLSKLSPLQWCLNWTYGRPSAMRVIEGLMYDNPFLDLIPKSGSTNWKPVSLKGFLKDK